MIFFSEKRNYFFEVLSVKNEKTVVNLISISFCYCCGKGGPERRNKKKIGEIN